MPKSLADLRQSPHIGLPEATFELCLAGKLNAELDAIDAELDRLLNGFEPAPRPDPDAPAPPGRMGRKAPHQTPRVQELNTRRDEIRVEMLEATVALGLLGLQDGAWRAWVNDNPPRDGNQADERAGHDIDALIEWIHTNPREVILTINGEPYSDDDWAFVWSNAADGDKWRLTARIRLLHQTAVDVPKSLSPWLAAPTSSNSSS